MTNTAPGWYEDGSGRLRWWSGTKWEDRYRNMPAQPPPPKPGTEYSPKMDGVAAPGLQPKTGGNGLLWGCIGCIVAPFVIFGIAAIASAVNGPSEYDANNKYEAISQCEARVTDMLKSPSTAKFESDATGSGTWKVTGAVDAENGFGAMLRSIFQCTVVISGDRATTTVDYLE